MTSFWVSLGFGAQLAILKKQNKKKTTAISSVCQRRPFTFSASYFLNPDLVVRSNGSLRAMTRVIDCHCLRMSSNEQWARTPVKASFDVRLVNNCGDV